MRRGRGRRLVIFGIRLVRVGLGVGRRLWSFGRGRWWGGILVCWRWGGRGGGGLFEGVGVGVRWLVGVGGRGWVLRYGGYDRFMVVMLTDYDRSLV